MNTKEFLDLMADESLELTIPFNGDSRTVTKSFPGAMIIALAIHGAKQKGNDSYVQTKKVDGKTVPIYPSLDDKFVRFSEVLSAVESGEWSTRETGDALERLILEMVNRAFMAKGVKGKARETAVEAFLADESNYARIAEKAKAELARRAEVNAGLVDLEVTATE